MQCPLMVVIPETNLDCAYDYMDKWLTHLSEHGLPPKPIDK
jgi:hypothetical protein